MKKIKFLKIALSLILTITIFISIFPTATADVSEYKNVEEMWKIVEKYSPNEYITAAVISQIWFESFCVSNVVGGGYTTDYINIKNYDEFITELIDEGMDNNSTKQEFINHTIDGYPIWGYGLIQWVEPNELEKLFDFAQVKGTSIGDAGMQVEFIFSNMQKWFPEVWDMLMECDNAGDAAVIFAHYIGGTSLAEKIDDRRWFAEELMKEYGE